MAQTLDMSSERNILEVHFKLLKTEDPATVGGALIQINMDPIYSDKQLSLLSDRGHGRDDADHHPHHQQPALL